MQDFIVEGSREKFFIPNIKLSAEERRGTIEGESYLEEPYQFYEDIFKWVSVFFEEGGEEFNLDIKLTYFNTASSRALLDLFINLKALEDSNYNITVNWFYPDPDDEEMLMEAEDFIEESELEMNLVEYEL
ncbi:DUF1987 domain-containing protein [Persicobacter diffluens]|uniref:SiaC family regulatory phosphoprotein domain-containing protein n=1 Tax=Persicobacter diffluens TaxID=981 RepID=A0AAN5AJA6_9BACT|nr:hypothetical protein PEDI_19720 [Persicobacter diffluens]